jgi:hypothetical protein
MFRLRAERDFYAGLLYVLLAAAFLWFGRNYKVGVASRMEPGYFPLTLGCVLGALGLVSIGRSFLANGNPVGGFAWRPLCLITLAVLAFATLLEPAGLILALPMLVTIAAMASEETRYDFALLVLLLGLTAFCITVFVKALGVPLPILGSWFDGLAPSSWRR